MGKGIWTCTRCGEVLSKKATERELHKCKKLMIEVEKLEKYDAEMCDMVSKLNGLLAYLHHLQEVCDKTPACACTKEVEGVAKPVNMVVDEHLTTCPFYELRHPVEKGKTL